MSDALSNAVAAAERASAKLQASRGGRLTSTEIETLREEAYIESNIAVAQALIASAIEQRQGAIRHG